MRVFLFILTALYTNAIFPQGSFSRTYGLEPNLLSTAFFDVFLDNDTLVFFGTCFPNDSLVRQTFFFTKADTSGNLIHSSYYPDPDGGIFATNQISQILKLSNGGYAALGGDLTSNFGCLILLNSFGELEHYKKYDPNPDVQVNPRKIVEVVDGYLISGYKQKPSNGGNLDILLLKTDKSGNLLWEKTYGQSQYTENMCSLLVIDENNIVIGGHRVSGLTLPYSSNTYVESMMLHVDSLGNIFQQQEGPKNERAGLCGLTPVSDGWIFGSSELRVNPSYLEKDLSIVRTGTDINDVKWELEFPNPTGNIVDYIIDLEPTPDGNFVVLATYTVLPHGSTATTMKFTPEGEMLWFRSDTIFTHPVTGRTDVFPSGMAVSPSGSIYVAAYANSQGYDPVRSYAWLLKITPDGCIDTTCAMTTSIEELAASAVKAEAISIFPNPSGGKFQWSSRNGAPIGQIEVWDATGKLIKTINGPQSKRQIDISDRPAGVFVVLFKGKQGQVLHSEKLIKH